VHELEPAAEYVPTEQEEQAHEASEPAEDKYVPAGQLAQTVELVDGR